MKRIPSWLTYTVLRLLVFAVPLVILLLVGVVWWLAVIAAALIGLCLSYIFLGRPRNAVSSDLYAARHPEQPVRSADADAEDAAVDARTIEARTVDARPVDARPVEARPVDAHTEAPARSEGEGRSQRDSD